MGLLSFSRSLAIKSIFLNNISCLNRSILIDLNPVELNCYPFISNLDKCSGTWSAIDDLSSKIFVPSETKDGNVQLFNTMLRINEVKILIKHISCDCKSKI